MIGNPDRRFRIDRLQEGVITYPKPRRSAGRIIRLYWLQSLAFVAFLVVVFLFAATGQIGN